MNRVAPLLFLLSLFVIPGCRGRSNEKDSVPWLRTTSQRDHASVVEDRKEPVLLQEGVSLQVSVTQMRQAGILEPVAIAFTVDAQGRVQDCAIIRPSLPRVWQDRLCTAIRSRTYEAGKPRRLQIGVGSPQLH